MYMSVLCLDRWPSWAWMAFTGWPARFAWLATDRRPMA
jgi:hypothetical protein